MPRIAKLMLGLAVILIALWAIGTAMSWLPW
jgi:hypothetical protein